MSRLLRKLAYFQGGGGVNEPTPGEKKYQSDPAIVVQPRFKEPFYRNYDLYTIPGMEDVGPGTGWHGMQNYKSVQEFLEDRRKRLQPRYVADDSWQIDSGERVKKNPDRQARMTLLNRIVKEARMPGHGLFHQLQNRFGHEECKDSDIEYTDRRDAFICGKCLHMGENSGGETPSAKEFHAGKNHNPDHIDWRNDGDRNDPKYLEWKANTPKDENDGSNFDYGHGAYDAMNEGKKMKSITDFERTSPGALVGLKDKNKSDNNDLGTGFYENLEHYKSVKDFIEHTPLGRNHGAKIKPEWERAKDVNHIDFPIDDMVNRQDQMIYPEEDEYNIRRMKGDRYQFPSDGSPLDPGELNISLTTPQISGEHTYLPDPDFEGKSDNGSQLDFGRDYTEETMLGRPSATEESLSDQAHSDDKEIDLDKLEAKYLASTETGLFGLPDGVDPEGHDADETVQTEQPYDTISDISNEMYSDKWNI